MDKIRFRCSACHQKYRVPPHYAGYQVRCKKCHAITIVPDPTAEPETDAAADINLSAETMDGQVLPFIQSDYQPVSPCPECGELMPRHAPVCPHCKAVF